MESERAVVIEEACRFCWMCRHLCPVALATGNEANTPRARALVASMDRRNFPFGRDSALKMFECVLCYACSDNCATGYDPTIFTREMRGRAIAEGLVSDEIVNLAEEVLNGNNPFVSDKNDTFDELIKDLPPDAPIYLYRNGYEKHALPLMDFLSRNEIYYRTDKEEKPSGAIACDFVGYLEEVRSIAADWVRWLDNLNVTTVICLNPADVFFLRSDASSWGIETKCHVVSSIEFAYELMKSGKLKKPNGKKIKGVYHDPSVLARNLLLTEEPRELLLSGGVSLVSLFLSYNLARSSGSLILSKINPALQTKVAKGLWDDIMATGSNTVITASPESEINLERSKPKSAKVYDIFELI